MDGGGVDGGEICIDDCRPGVGGDWMLKLLTNWSESVSNVNP